jgi:hypothetical protein
MQALPCHRIAGSRSSGQCHWEWNLRSKNYRFVGGFFLILDFFINFCFFYARCNSYIGAACMSIPDPIVPTWPERRLECGPAAARSGVAVTLALA